MSDLLTHWAVFDDCRRLLPYAPGIEPMFSTALAAELPKARLGSIVRTEGYWIPPLLRRARTERHAAELTPTAQRQLALCVAGLTHTACDRAMKPLMQHLTITNANVPELHGEDVHRLVYAYQDTFVFREVYANGAEAPFNPFMFANNTSVPGLALEQIVQTAFVGGLLELRTMAHTVSDIDREAAEPVMQRALTRVREGDGPARTLGSNGLSRRPVYDWLQAAAAGVAVAETWDEVAELLTPNLSDPLAEFDNLLQGVQWLYVDLERLIRAYHNPDPELIHRFSITEAFYNANDPVIRLARSIQRGASVDRDRVPEALNETNNTSAYGQALALGIAYLQQASAFWRGERNDLHTPNYESTGFRRWIEQQNTLSAQRQEAR
jgi:hypothetical protein